MRCVLLVPHCKFPAAFIFNRLCGLASTIYSIMQICLVQDQGGCGDWCIELHHSSSNSWNYFSMCNWCWRCQLWVQAPSRAGPPCSMRKGKALQGHAPHFSTCRIWRIPRYFEGCPRTLWAWTDAWPWLSNPSNSNAYRCYSKFCDPSRVIWTC